jgi:hypothetical protein
MHVSDELVAAIAHDSANCCGRSAGHPAMPNETKTENLMKDALSPRFAVTDVWAGQSGGCGI